MLQAATLPSFVASTVVCATPATSPATSGAVAPATPLFSKRACLFGLDAARDARAAPTDASDGDDAALSDAGAQSLSLGRCVNEAGEDCEGDVEGGRFEALAPDSVVPIVIGFQGSPMFVLAIRAVGVDPGDPEDPFGPDNPQVELLVFDEAGVEVAAYRDRAPLHVEAGGAEGLSYFVVLGGATSEVADAPLRVDAWLRDRAGVELRASLDIVAGPAP